MPRYIEKLERQAARHAQQLGYDGVIRGHIHRANLRRIRDTLYGNSADWVESCSALLESQSGALELLRWPQPQDDCAPDARPAGRGGLRPAR